MFVRTRVVRSYVRWSDVNERRCLVMCKGNKNIYTQVYCEAAQQYFIGGGNRKCVGCRVQSKSIFEFGPQKNVRTRRSLWCHTAIEHASPGVHILNIGSYNWYSLCMYIAQQTCSITSQCKDFRIREIWLNLGMSCGARCRRKWILAQWLVHWN